MRVVDTRQEMPKLLRLVIIGAVGVSVGYCCGDWLKWGNIADILLNIVVNLGIMGFWFIVAAQSKKYARFVFDPTGQDFMTLTMSYHQLKAKEPGVVPELSTEELLKRKAECFKQAIYYYVTVVICTLMPAMQQKFQINRIWLTGLRLTASFFQFPIAWMPRRQEAWLRRNHPDEVDWGLPIFSPPIIVGLFLFNFVIVPSATSIILTLC